MNKFKQGALGVMTLFCMTAQQGCRKQPAETPPEQLPVNIHSDTLRLNVAEFYLHEKFPASTGWSRLLIVGLEARTRPYGEDILDGSPLDTGNIRIDVVYDKKIEPDRSIQSQADSLYGNDYYQKEKLGAIHFLMSRVDGKDVMTGTENGRAVHSRVMELTATEYVGLEVHANRDGSNPALQKKFRVNGFFVVPDRFGNGQIANRALNDRVRGGRYTVNF